MADRVLNVESTPPIDFNLSKKLKPDTLAGNFSKSLPSYFHFQPRLSRLVNQFETKFRKTHSLKNFFSRFETFRSRQT